ncbi:MAG: DNA-binding protein [Bdellovibrionaceae bacterium]|nr:DNA-binding protein [Pseudobdellovibrionaceae bacterium]|tara:strand:- start:597 stop:875 length:279 start_codon:yes stop_codon:yes gene_type:complete
MNKAQFIDKIAKKTGHKKQEIESIIDAALDIIQSTVARGDEVKLVGFGVFDRSQRQARNAVHPKTGDKLKLPETRFPRFRPGKSFKILVQNK